MYTKRNTCSSGSGDSPLHETTLLRNGDGATLSYQVKVKKNVLVSTLHSIINTETNHKKIPKTLQFYNKTKCRVDILDQKARKYSTRAAARRWPVHIFYNILDLTAINAWIIYRGVTGEEMSRRAFLRQHGRNTKRNVNLRFQNTK